LVGEGGDKEETQKAQEFVLCTRIVVLPGTENVGGNRGFYSSERKRRLGGTALRGVNTADDGCLLKLRAKHYQLQEPPLTGGKLKGIYVTDRSPGKNQIRVKKSPRWFFFVFLKTWGENRTRIMGTKKEEKYNAPTK